MWRSLGMLRAVRGLIVVSLLLGVVASALPYISAAAFGPMVQVIAEAGESGNLSGVWDLRGPLVARDNGLLQVGGRLGPVRGAAGDVGGRTPADAMDVLRQHLGRREGRPAALGGHPATRPRPPAIAVAGLLHQVAQRRADTASDRRTGWRATPPDRLSASAADRYSRTGRGYRLSTGHLMADDGRRAGADTAGLDHAEDTRAAVSRQRCDG